MCGIAGIFNPNGKYTRDGLRSAATAMARVLRHRGPDDEGTWTDPSAGIAFGFRRLSILDLSQAGHQPMQSVPGRFTIVFNGEIYNVEQLRRELLHRDPSLQFRGHSDTEVMLAAFEAWGIEAALARFNGMFAFAVWDSRDRTLTLARDRIGEKPLYYGWFGGTLLFASELKSLRQHPDFDAGIDRDALALLLRYNCIPAPCTVYAGVRKVPPATLLTIRGESEVAEKQFWSLSDAAVAGRERPFQGSPQQAAEQLEALLLDAVRLRMIADVPLGAFLSGGVDSSTLVALMQAASSRPVHTFTIGVTESSYDEAGDARMVARHLGTNHTEWYVTPAEVQAAIPGLAEIYDEPFADSSQLPTCIVAALARKHVTVALSGDGGDEVFGGYNRYLWLPRVWNSAAWMPPSMRRATASAFTRVPTGAWDALYRMAAPLLPQRLRQRLPGEKLHKIAEVMQAPDAYGMYTGLASHWQQPERVVIGATEPAHVVRNTGSSAISRSLVERMMYLDTLSYLPDDILVKLDRATMAVSLEARVPILDHRVIEFACCLPLDFKIRDGQGKWILRQVLYRHVPAHLVERPKMGFGVPLHAWLRGPLRSWAESLLEASRLRSEGFFEPALIRQRWSEHLSGRRDWGYHLWDVLMFQSWHEATRSNLRAAVGA